MSYNITSFRVKALDKLTIGDDSVITSDPRGWYWETTTDQQFSRLSLTCIETVVTGTVAGNMLRVDHLNCSGEGSGIILEDLLKPMLKKSTGTLVATCIWEGGGSISELTVKDGVITERQITDL